MTREDALDGMGGARRREAGWSDAVDSVGLTEHFAQGKCPDSVVSVNIEVDEVC